MQSAPQDTRRYQIRCKEQESSGCTTSRLSKIAHRAALVEEVVQGSNMRKEPCELVSAVLTPEDIPTLEAMMNDLLQVPIGEAVGRQVGSIWSHCLLHAFNADLYAAAFDRLLHLKLIELAKLGTADMATAKRHLPCASCVDRLCGELVRELRNSEPAPWRNPLRKLPQSIQQWAIAGSSQVGHELRR